MALETEAQLGQLYQYLKFRKCLKIKVLNTFPASAYSQ